MITVAGEGLTDYIVVKNLLIGIYDDKDLAVSKLRPKDTEPFGWGNLFNFLSSKEFQEAVEYSDSVIVQIDTDTCQEWGKGLVPVTQNEEIGPYIDQVTNIIIEKIGLEFYEQNNQKIFFAIAVNSIECWLLAFIGTRNSHFSKIVNCANAVEQLLAPHDKSINQKNYQGGKYFDEMSSEMKLKRILLKKYTRNISLAIFVDKVIAAIPDQNTIENNDEEFDENNPSNNTDSSDAPI